MCTSYYTTLKHKIFKMWKIQTETRVLYVVAVYIQTFKVILDPTCTSSLYDMFYPFCTHHTIRHRERETRRDRGLQQMFEYIQPRIRRILSLIKFIRFKYFTLTCFIIWRKNVCLQSIIKFKFYVRTNWNSCRIYWRSRISKNGFKLAMYSLK